MIERSRTAYGQSKKQGGRGAKKKDSQYDKKVKRILREMGLEPDEEEEDRFLLSGAAPLYGAGMNTPLMAGGYSAMPGGLERSMALPVYDMPPSMMQGSRAQGHNTIQQRPVQMPYHGDGQTSAINIQYTAADGTMYQMSMVTSEQNKAKGLQNMLAGLYCMMMSEGDKGYTGSSAYKPGRAGTGSGKAYSGGKGGK